MFKRKHTLGENLFPSTLNSMLVVFVIFCATMLFALCPVLRLSRYMALCYAIIIACGGWIAIRASIPAGVMFIWGAVICLVHETTSILAALAILMYALVLIFIISQEIKKTWIYNAVCVIAILCVYEQWLQIWGMSVIFRSAPVAHHTLTGTFGNINETSAFIAVCLPAFFRKGWAWALPVPVAGLVMAESLIGVMAAGVMGCAYVALEVKGKRSKVKKAVVVLLLLAAGTGYTVFVDQFDWERHKNSRLITWQESADAAMQKPVLGWGFGQYSAVVPMLSTPMLMDIRIRRALYAEIEDKKAFTDVVQRWSKGDVAGFYAKKEYPKGSYFEAHNEYVETLFAAGIPGLVFLIIAILAILWRGGRKRLEVEGPVSQTSWPKAVPTAYNLIPFYGFLASCVAATVFFIWQIVPIAVITVVWAGLCLKPVTSLKSQGPGYKMEAFYD